MKKTLLFIAALVMSVCAWAQTVVTTPQVSTASTIYEYTLECRAADGHSARFIGLNNGSLFGQCASADALRFQFESVEGGWHIFTGTAESKKYFNFETSATLDATATTVWEFRTSFINNCVGLAPVGTASGKALNNNGGSNKLQMGNFTSAGNACSHWEMTEYEEDPNAVRVNVTYNYYYNNELWEAKTYTTEQKSGALVEAPRAVSFANMNYDAEATVGETDMTVRVDLTDALPFTAAADFASISQWYSVRLHSNQTHYQCVTEEGALAFANALGEDATAFAWGFVGNLKDGFKMYNYNGKAVNNSNPCALDEEGYAFPLAASQVSGGFCFLPEAGNYLNYQGGAIKRWNSNDAGSTFRIEELTIEETVAPDVTLMTEEGTEYALNENSPVSIDQAISAIKVAGLNQEKEYNYKFSEGSTTLVEGLLSVNTIGYAEYAPLSLYEGHTYTLTLTSGSETLATYTLVGAMEEEGGDEAKITTNLDDVVIKSVEEFEGIEITFVGATTVAVDAEETRCTVAHNAEPIIYAWDPFMNDFFDTNSQCTIEGNKVTLTGFFDYTQFTTMTSRYNAKRKAAMDETKPQFELALYGFIVDGTPIEEAYLYFDAEGNATVKFAPTAVSPEEGTVEGELETVTLTFDKAVSAAEGKVAVVSAMDVEKEKIAEVVPTVSEDGMTATFALNLTEANIYFLALPEGLFTTEDGEVSEAKEYTWTLTEAEEAEPVDLDKVFIKSQAGEYFGIAGGQVAVVKEPFAWTFAERTGEGNENAYQLCDYDETYWINTGSNGYLSTAKISETNNIRNYYFYEATATETTVTGKLVEAPMKGKDYMIVVKNINASPNNGLYAIYCSLAKDKTDRFDVVKISNNEKEIPAQFTLTTESESSNGAIDFQKVVWNLVNENTTGIATATTTATTDAIFSITGQRIMKLQKGINIVGGKKVIR